MVKSIVELQSISRSFGGIQALYDISFQVTQGTIQAVIGPNGAGKTTLFNIVTGLYAPDEGQVLFEGRPIQGRPIHHIVRMGIARTFQNVELFGSMTVLENVLVGRHSRMRSGFWGAIGRWKGVRREEADAVERAMELLRFTGLEEQAGQKSSDLPFGWQRFLEIARALASDPRLLLLDEPASGLNAVETSQLGELLLKIRDQGVTLLLVEHDMSLTMGISDHIQVLHQGRRLAEGTPREIQSNDAVVCAYLGKD
ncbi:MAG: ABC transporter ATP-binding protein [Syntrophobacteraceae bacterium]|nr:ABC transporter ATP-binding protein [Syntrophobacteraceae bacterium]